MAEPTPTSSIGTVGGHYKLLSKLGEGAFGDASGARLWAWRTSLIKWISQTKKDGSCFLPTRDMVERAATACLATGASAGGEIQGCQVR